MVAPDLAEVLVNTTLTCSSTGGAPSPSYYWLNETSMLSDGPTVTVTEQGNYSLTCVANSTFGEVSCVTKLNVSVAAVLGLLQFCLEVKSLTRYTQVPFDVTV